MSLACYSYTLPFATPLQTSTRIYDDRKGFILSYKIQDQQFYSEAAPLPGFSNESFDQVEQLLISKKEIFDRILSNSNPVERLQNTYLNGATPASLQFGLDFLAYQIEANQSAKSLPAYLFPNIATKVPVNVLISLQNGDPIPKIEQHLKRGYNTIKCKVGLDIDRELHQIKKVRSHFPDLKIRIDANQAWTLEEAIKFANRFRKLNIEYCEEPLVQTTPAHFEELSKNTELPIALDETIAQHSYWPNLLPFTQYLVIKPMVMGSIKRNIETKRLADTHNNKVVVTSSLESGVGRYFTGILAAGMGSSHTANGLSTGNLLVEDIFKNNSFISNGYFRISKDALPAIDFNRPHIFSNLFLQ